MLTRPTMFVSHSAGEDPTEHEGNGTTGMTFDRWTGEVRHYALTEGGWTLTHLGHITDRARILALTDPYWKAINLAIDKADRERLIEAGIRRADRELVKARRCRVGEYAV